MGTHYDSEEWVEFLTDGDMCADDVDGLSVFLTLAWETWHTYTCDGGLIDRLPDPLDDPHYIAYLTLCEAVGHGTGFWCKGLDLKDPDDSRAVVAYSEFLEGQATLIDMAHDINDQLAPPPPL